MFDCESGAPLFCDRHLDTLANTALTTQGDNPAKAQTLWQQVFDELAVQSPVIPFATTSTAFLVSERANANYQSASLRGPLLDQMWAR